MLLFPLMARLEAPSPFNEMCKCRNMQEMHIEYKIRPHLDPFLSEREKGGFIYFTPTPSSPPPRVLMSTADIVYLVKHHKLISKLEGGVRLGENIL